MIFNKILYYLDYNIEDKKQKQLSIFKRNILFENIIINFKLVMICKINSFINSQHCLNNINKTFFQENLLKIENIKL